MFKTLIIQILIVVKRLSFKTHKCSSRRDNNLERKEKRKIRRTIPWHSKRINRSFMAPRDGYCRRCSGLRETAGGNSNWHLSIHEIGIGFIRFPWSVGVAPPNGISARQARHTYLGSYLVRGNWNRTQLRLNMALRLWLQNPWEQTVNINGLWPSLSPKSRINKLLGEKEIRYSDSLRQTTTG